jgi:hypothetical protein
VQYKIFIAQKIRGNSFCFRFVSDEKKKFFSRFFYNKKKEKKFSFRRFHWLSGAFTARDEKKEATSIPARRPVQSPKSPAVTPPPAPLSAEADRSPSL